VAQNIAKYNLLAMPVVDAEGRLLGIVTVDDALEVLQEEHEEDLQIAGSTAGVSPDDRGGLLGQLVSSEMWCFFWAAGIMLCTLLYGAIKGDYMPGLVVSAAMPVALRLADGMARYAINSYLQYDEDDEDAPTLLGFAVKGVVVSGVFAALVLLVMIGVGSVVRVSVLPSDAAGASGQTPYAIQFLNVLLAGFKAAALAAVVSFATAPAYLLSLRRRDSANKDTSGVVLRGIALGVATVIFVVFALLALQGMVG